MTTFHLQETSCVLNVCFCFITSAKEAVFPSATHSQSREKTQHFEKIFTAVSVGIINVALQFLMGCSIIAVVVAALSVVGLIITDFTPTTDDNNNKIMKIE